MAEWPTTHNWGQSCQKTEFEEALASGDPNKINAAIATENARTDALIERLPKKAEPPPPEPKLDTYQPPLDLQQHRRFRRPVITRFGREMLTTQFVGKKDRIDVNSPYKK